MDGLYLSISVAEVASSKVILERLSEYSLSYGMYLW
jgi:hypothetical protein